jgi:hypothetical protein
MPKRDCAAVDVVRQRSSPELFFHSQLLRGESLVHFDEIHLVER